MAFPCCVHWRTLFPVFLLVFIGSNGGPLNAEKPNFIVVLADDLGIGDITPTNPNCKIKTPKLQQLADEGLTFLDAHSSSAVCTPTRYGLLTGRYNWRSRLSRGVLGGYSSHLIPSDRPTIAHMLKARGYHTAMIGKWHLGWDWGKRDVTPAIEDGSSPLPKKKEVDFSKPVRNGPDINGFDQYYAHCGSLDMPPYVWVDTGRVTAIPTREEGVSRREDRFGWYRKGPIAPDFEIEQVLPHLFDKAIKHIETRAKSNQPFFLYLALPAPHTPIVPVAPFRGASGMNPYADFVMQVDHHMGELMASLKATGIDDQTLVIFTSDNGCSPEADFKHLREQHKHDPSAGYRGHKADIYEGGHRVPMVARWPGKIVAGKETRALTCLTDLYSTFEELVGPVAGDQGGEDSFSLVPVFQGAAKSTRDSLVSHSINGHFAIRQGKWKLCLSHGSGGWSQPQEKPAKQAGLPPVQLFDLQADPAETSNVVASHESTKNRLMDLLSSIVKQGRSTPGPQLSNDRQIQIQVPETNRRPSDKQKEATKSKVIYKRVGDQELELLLDKPTNWKPTDRRPAMVFFFGGGWVGGQPKQFQPQSEYFASRGMVGIRVRYRVVPNRKDPPIVCCEDAKSAMRFVRSHAAELGINPDRIAAAGGSAGGHLAAFTSMVEGLDAESDDLSISPRANALVLFNPVFDNGPQDGYGFSRVGNRYREFSPAHNISSDDPPTLVFLGSRDRLIPVSVLERFEKSMKSAGVLCQTHVYPGAGHGFFNAEPSRSQTLAEADAFLVRLGWLPSQIPASK